MKRFGRVRAEGRKAIIAASALGLADVGVAADFVNAVSRHRSRRLRRSSRHRRRSDDFSPSVSAHVQRSDTGVRCRSSARSTAASFALCPGGTSRSVGRAGEVTFSRSRRSWARIFRSTSVYEWAIVPTAETIMGHATNSPTGALVGAVFTFTDSQPTRRVQVLPRWRQLLDVHEWQVRTRVLVAGVTRSQSLAEVGSNPPERFGVFRGRLIRRPVDHDHLPADGGDYNSPGWSADARQPGSAARIRHLWGHERGRRDPSAVEREVLERVVTFSSSSIMFNNATGTTAWKYAKALRPTVTTRCTCERPTVSATRRRATSAEDRRLHDRHGRAGRAETGSRSRRTPSNDKSPEFEFTTKKQQSKFTCRLDSGTTVDCTGDTDHDGDDHDAGILASTMTTTRARSASGRYQLCRPDPTASTVCASDQAGNQSPTTSFCWTINGAVANTIAVVSGTAERDRRRNVRAALKVAAAVAAIGAQAGHRRSGARRRAVVVRRPGRASVLQAQSLALLGIIGGGVYGGIVLALFGKQWLAAFQARSR